MSFFSAQYIWSQHSRLHFVHANSMKNTYCNEMPFVVFFIPLSTLLSLMSQMDLRHNLRAFASISRVNFSHLKMGSNAVWHFVWLWSNGKIAKQRHYHFKGRSAPLVWKLRKLTTVSVTDVVNSPRGRFPRIGTFVFNTFLLCVSRHICV